MKEQQELFIMVQGVRTHYMIAGEGDSVLVLHGWGGSSDSWNAVQVRLAQHGYLVVVPDLPGFGKTPVPDTAWGLKEYLSFVYEFSKAVGFSHFFLVGHSFGGKISVKFAVRYPDLLKGLILVDSAGIPTRFNVRTWFIKKSIKMGKVLLSPRIFSWARESFKNLLYVFLKNSDYAKAKGIMKEIMKKILSEPILFDLPLIRTSTLIVWGEKDRMTPLEDAYVFQKNIPGASLKTFPNVGHSPHLKISEEFAQVVADFLKKNL